MSGSDDLDDVLDDDLQEELENGEVDTSADGDAEADDDSDDDGVDVLGGLKASLHTLSLTPAIVASPLLGVLPASWRIYHKINRWSAWQMQKAASADALANVRRPNDKEDLLPAAYVQADADDNGRTGWKIKGIDDKRYDPGVRGGSSSRYGKADLIHVNEDDLEQGTWAEAAMDAAIQLNRENYLFRNAGVTVEQNVIARVPTANGAGDGQAVADGGATASPETEFQTQSVDVSLQKPGILEDALVPLHSRTGYDGQLVSFKSYQNLKQEQADQETVRDAKNAGWMAAKLDDIGKGDVMKWALILGAAGVLLLFHQDIGAAISSFGGGGGSNPAPSAGLGLIPLLARRLGGD